ncbi:hypothetical protein EDD16DRAFT_1531757 [Pisolithus croceorrhizus]|nr:hypothetical protein EDD16DRAFT_1531757 [Pisolithus croceorrhizus]
MTQYPALHHFKKGISLISQWTSTEHKEMQRVFVGLLASAVDDHILVVAHSLLDFIYYTQLQCHTDTTLVAMEESLKTFHAHKHVLVKLGVHKDFNVPKIHSMQHYVTSIQVLGSADSYNTEYPEQLHIDYAKDGYWASNKCDYMEQMALWLQHREAMYYKSVYLAWRKPHWVSLESGCKGNVRDSETHIGDPAQSTGVSDLPDSPVLQMSAVKAHYKVVKIPPCHQVSTDSIECQKLDQFDVNNCLYVTSGPSIIAGHSQSFQKIHALPKIATHGWKAETPARFNSMFAIDREIYAH